VFVSITLDGDRVIAQRFDVEGQHNFVDFPLDPPPGDHVLRAIADDGTAIEQPFTLPVGERRYGTLFYWADSDAPPFFDFHFSDEPPVFG
jgi:hypothetical protein